MRLELAIILPTLNERDNIAPLVTRLHGALGETGWEAIFVDDDSKDGTAEEVRRIAQFDKHIRVIHRIGRRGLASAAIEGMCATAAPFVAVMDADHQHDPKLLLPMLESVRSGEADIAVASRFISGASVTGLSSDAREKNSRFANALARKLTGTDLSDAMSGYFLLPAVTLRAQAGRLSGIGFKILLDILGSAHEPLKVKEFALEFAERATGESKLDHGVGLDFLVGLYERYLGRYIPTRFALFGTVGSLGVGVHMAVLTLLYLALSDAFILAQSVATFTAMTFNFWLNNFLTYRDQKLRGIKQILTGWLSFCITCMIGAVANVGVASLLQERGVYWWGAALIGITLGSVWNYALSSRFVWGRYK
ncbi:glycosyltransferase [Altererythrobacter indicus]|uniref:Glycosyltransferase n=1 Tax=Altericroceibacterium indicum TaxID=374177 RepID=A0A845AI54_9SPHN|nr:glycosyltransferase family 2 protein [Altericroceibacterium indicum]MXP26788.1 glycosyltransferase [Altericroceibacterium indicum]